MFISFSRASWGVGMGGYVALSGGGGVISFLELYGLLVWVATWLGVSREGTECYSLFVSMSIAQFRVV